MSAHQPEPDGYCWQCRRVPCVEKSSGKRAGQWGQLDRIEAKLNRLLRAAGIDADTPTTR